MLLMNFISGKMLLLVIVVDRSELWVEGWVVAADDDEFQG